MEAEADALCQALLGSLRRIAATLEGVSSEEARRQPNLPESNSLSVIAGHALANAERNVLGTYVGGPYAWDREAEFRLGSRDADLAARWDVLRARIEAAIQAAGPAALDRTCDHPRLGPVSGRTVLIQAVRHAAEHVGEAELTRKLVLAARADLPALPPPEATPPRPYETAAALAHGPAPFVVGVDGCPAGWVAAVLDVDQTTLGIQVFATFAELLTALGAAAAIAIDMPIGLLEGPPRPCDGLARKELGARASTVFPAPCRQVLDCADYPTALATMRAATGGKGMSAQAFGIVRKVREVDAIMTPDLQRHVREAHPELAFANAAGTLPLSTSKKTPEGFAERRAILARAFPRVAIPARDDIRHIARGAGPDDVLDAIALTWTALRLHHGTAIVRPPTPDLDSRGLRMEVVT